MKQKLLGLLALSLLLAACGKSSSSTGDATAKLKFTRAARMFSLADAIDALAPARVAPTTFRMKFIAAYLTADIAAGTGNNVGTTTMVYLNTECANDIMHCDVSAGTAEDGTPFSHVISTFFDFTDATAANTAINSQSRPINSGTFKYARLEFCKYATGSDANIQWTHGSNTSSFRQASCSANSAEIVPPITIATGGSATVNFTYDMTNSVSTSAVTGPQCNGGECFQVPAFIPSATVRY